MDTSIWNMDIEEIEEQELTEEELKIAKECSEIEMEFQEAISMLNNEEE